MFLPNAGLAQFVVAMAYGSATMVLLLLLTICCASSCVLADPPPYIESLRSLKTSEKLIQKNLLSMDGNIPLLNDPRRHYAEIIHIINDVAHYIARSGVQLPYDVMYKLMVNDSLSESICNPNKVIKDTEKFLKLFQSKSENIFKLIETTCKHVTDIDCNEVVNSEVRLDPKKYQEEAKLLLVGGNTASEFIMNADKFETIASHFEATKFVIEGASQLKSIITKLKEVIHIIDPFPFH